MGIGEILGSIGSAAQELEHVGESAVSTLSKIPDPIAMGVSAVGNALGLDPKLTGMLELGVGVLTGDVMCGIHGANDILNNKGTEGTTGPAPGADSGYASSMSPHDALQTVRDNFAAIDSNGDGKITESELRAAANSENPKIADAAKFLLSHGDVTGDMGQIANGGKYDQIDQLTHTNEFQRHGFSLSSLDEELTKYPGAPIHHDPNETGLKGPTYSAPQHTDAPSGATGAAAPASSEVSTAGMDYDKAMQVLDQNFDLLDTAAGVGKRDGLIGRNDLQAALKNPDVPADVKAACKFLLDNPAYFNEADVAGNSAAVDGLIGHGDVKAALEKAKASGASATDASSDAAPADEAGGDKKASDSNKTSGSQQSDASQSTDSDAFDTQIDKDMDAILNNPKMSIEQKVMMILAKLAEKEEHHVHAATAKLVGIQKDNKGKKAEDQQSTTEVNQELQEAMSKMSELRSLATNFSKNEHDTKMSVINNIR